MLGHFQAISIPLILVNGVSELVAPELARSAVRVVVAAPGAKKEAQHK